MTTDFTDEYPIKPPAPRLCLLSTVSLAAGRREQNASILPPKGGTTRSKKPAGQFPENFPTNKIFLPPIPGLGAEVFHPLNSGSSLFPMGEQTKPILSFGGIDRSWASSRDESLRERLRLIVSARGFLGPAHRRQVIAVCDQQDPVPYTGDDQSEG